MKALLALALMLLAAAPAFSDEATCPKNLPPAVEARLSPVLRALDSANKRNDIWDKRYRAAFDKLMDAKDTASAEARVALMDYYVGEAFGEQLACAVALGGRASVAMLEKYSRCDIAPVHPVMTRSHELPVREHALTMIRKGNAKESCTFE